MVKRSKKKIIQLHAEHMFGSFMKRVFMILGVNRNVKDNYIVRLLAGFEEEAEPGQDTQVDDIKNRIKEQLTPNGG